jgi:hypothetical protein
MVALLHVEYVFGEICARPWHGGRVAASSSQKRWHGIAVKRR